MNQYWSDKFITASAVGLAIAVCTAMAPSLAQSWQWLVMLMMLAGYTHFFIGGFYQWRGVQRRQRSYEQRWFWALTVVSLVIAWATIQLFGLTLFVVGTLMYFLLHGYFNELTLYERQTGKTASQSLVAAVMLFFLGTLLYGIGHPSWFFNASLTFALPSATWLAAYSTTDPIALIATWLGGIVLVMALLLAAYHWVRRPGVVNSLGLLGLTSGIALTFLFQPIPYVYVLVGVLLYHFIVWFVFYAHQFAARSKVSLQRYLLFHVVLIGGAVLVSDFIATHPIFNMAIFLTFTTWHITASFLNEPWFKRWVGLA